MQAEARPYDQVMTPDERARLLSRVFVIEPRIVFYREIPVPTAESIDLMLGRLAVLAEDWPKFVEVLDLRGVARPTPEVRAALKRWMDKLSPRMTLVVVILADNPVMKA